MEATSILIAAMAVMALVLAGVRIVAWRVFVALGQAVPALVPRLAGTRIWVGSAPLRRHARTSFPRTYGFVIDRLAPSHFAGLPLTLIVVAALYTLALLAGLVDDVRETEGLVRLDLGFNAFFVPYRAPWLLAGFLWITAIGAGPSLTAVLATATAMFWAGGRARDIGPLWLTFLGAQATTWSSKYMIGRTRPDFLPSITEWNPSFPSGHATASTALIGLLAYLVGRQRSDAKERFDIGFGSIVLIALICFSRLFLNLHFLTDVLAGILVGTFWILVGYMVANLARLRAKPVTGFAEHAMSGLDIPRRQGPR